MATPGRAVPAPRADWRTSAGAVIHGFETLIVLALIVMMAIVVILSTIELGWTILADIGAPPFEVLRLSELFELFGVFLIVLISVELLNSLRAYLVEQRLHVQVVLQVALISVARRVILLEVAETTNLTLLALAMLVLALAAAYFVQSRVGASGDATAPTPSPLPSPER